MPTFRSPCYILRHAPFTDFGKLRALVNLLILVPLFQLKFLNRIRPIVVQELQIGGTSAVGLIFATTWRGQSPLHPVDLIEACQLGAGQIQARTRSFDPPPPPGKEAGRFASKKDRLIVRLVVLSVVRPANPQPALVGSYREVSRAPPAP